MTKNNEQIINQEEAIKMIKKLNEKLKNIDDYIIELRSNFYRMKQDLVRKKQECETLASQLDFEVQKKECLEQECEELKKKIKNYQCNEKNANRCICAFRCLENAFCNDAENKIDEIQTKIKVLKIENEILSNKLEQEENWHKSADKISKTNSEYTAKLKQTLTEIKEIVTTSMEQNTLINLDKILQKINEVEDDRT